MNRKTFFFDLHNNTMLKLALIPLLVLAILPFALAQEPEPITIDVNEVKTELVTLLNDYRIENGLNPLSYDPSIEAVALSHSNSMLVNDFFDHISPIDGKGPNTRAYAAGYFICGDPTSVENYNQVMAQIPTYQKRIKEYNELLTLWKTGLQPNNDMLGQELLKQGTQLNKELQIINQKIHVVNSDIDNRKIGTGFGENIQAFYFEELNMTEKEFAERTLDNWVNSPGHHAVLIEPASLFGVGIDSNSDNGTTKILITLNHC